MKRAVAVLGANGLIGGALIQGLASHPRLRPVALVRSRMAAAALRLRFGDDLEVRLDGATSGCEAAVNCAFAAALGLRASRLANLSLIRSLASARTLEHVVHLSSVAVYGAGSESSEAPRPITAYGREKLAHEAAARLGRGAVAIVRVGHVYGAHQPMSRFILHALEQPEFALPDDGGLASNCVSRPRLVAALLSHLEGGRAGTYDLVDDPQSSWRRIFDLHSEAAGLRRARSLDAARSEKARRSALSGADDSWKSVLTDFSRSFNPAGLASLSRAPSIRARLDSLLAAAPAPIEAWLRSRHARAAVAGQLRALPDDFAPLPEWLFHSPAPGVPMPGSPAGADFERELVELRAWSARLRDPRWAFEPA